MVISHSAAVSEAAESHEEKVKKATGLFQILSSEGELGANASLPAPELLQEMYRSMKYIRLLDERMMMRQRQGRIGFYGAITGQEAAPVATALATEESDWIFPALRESGIMLMRGFPLSRYLAQVYGSSDDLLKGRQMPSHMSAKQTNQVAWSSCLGPQLPQAVGAAYAARYKKNKNVMVGFIGDGATSEPDFHCALNFAGVWNTPSVIICQNNQWAISVPSSKQSASKTFAIKALAYGVEGVRVDGNDVVAMYLAIKNAVEKARRGDGPTFIEAVTYRIGAHSSSDDPTLYRSNEEVEEWKTRDPILRLENYLISQGALDETQIEKLETEIVKEIVEAIKEAETFDCARTEDTL